MLINLLLTILYFDRRDFGKITQQQIVNTPDLISVVKLFCDANRTRKPLIHSGL